jgi:Zn-dependent alcohol dehydrogenase
MKSTAAIFVGNDKPYVVDEVDIPDPRPDQVIVKLSYTGLCHSQLHQKDDPNSIAPSIFGHEAAGNVTHLGSQVKDLKEGDQVIVTWVSKHNEVFSGLGSTGPASEMWSIPGTTYRGVPINEVVVHAWAEDVLVRDKFVVRIANNDPPDVSCIVGCAVLTGAGAVKNTANVRPGDSVAVIGAGGVGLSAIQMASILHAYPIIAVDLDDGKLEFARQFGATHTINATNTEPVQAIIELTKGGADFAFDTIGVRATTEQILPAVRGGGPGAGNRGGTAVMVGMPAPEISLDPGLFFMGQRGFVGSLGAAYPPGDFEMYLRWNREGKFPLDKLVTKRFRLEEINEAMDELRAGEILGRAVIKL